MTRTRDDGVVACGVDIGGTNVRIGIGTPSGILETVGDGAVSSRHSTPTELGPKELAAWLCERITEMVPAGATLGATVIGVPGAVHPKSGEIRTAPNLPQIEEPSGDESSFGEAVRSTLAGEVHFENDANCAVLGEAHAGAATGRSDVVMVSVGTGLGASVILDGSLLTGRTGIVGEFGGLPYDSATIEDLAAGAGLERRARAMKSTVTDASPVFADPVFSAVRQKAIEVFSHVLLLVTTAYEPEVIVLGGGVARAYLPWFKEFQASLAEITPEPPEIVLATLGDSAGVIGAQAEAARRLVRATSTR